MTRRHANVVKEMLSMKCNTIFYDNFVLVSGSYAYNHRITPLASLKHHDQPKRFTEKRNHNKRGNINVISLIFFFKKVKIEEKHRVF